MARIKIRDLPKHMKITEAEMLRVRGGMGIRLSVDNVSVMPHFSPGQFTRVPMLADMVTTTSPQSRDRR